MKIRQLTREDMLWSAAYHLFERGIREEELLYAPLSEEAFYKKFWNESKNTVCINLIEEGGRAFASGCVDRHTNKSYVSLVLTDRPARRQGLGRTILKELEKLLEEKQTEISFFNPVAFEWQVPGRKKAFHPNTPGVDVASGAYVFFQNCGYRTFAVQNSYYLPLKEYCFQENIMKRRKELEEQGFVFTAYDSSVHKGMKEMLSQLGNPVWEHDILNEPALAAGGRTILVPVRENMVCGFAGPLDVEENGRGYFAGIAISPSCRGAGLAKVLFGTLCQGLKEMGAEYMTLFTGQNNPARNIYEAAGFSIVRTWADMRKEKDYGT